MEIRNSKGQFTKGSGIKNLVGNRYGKLTVVRFSQIKDQRTYWICRCDCGNEKEIRGDCLNRIQSCGCVKKECDKKNLHITNNHGMSKHPLYATWCCMIDRCTDMNNPAYKHYGGRGIKVCDEWKDPRNFCKWAEKNGYEAEKGLSIERIDVDGNYEPSNCTWIPLNQQAYNRRCSIRFIDSDGKEKILAVEARKHGLPTKTASDRYKRGIRNPTLLLYKGNIQNCEDYQKGNL